MRESVLSAELLAWYDRHARDMPWRVGPAARAAGMRPDPYAVWLSEIMLQQTTVAAVRGYFTRFLSRWPDVGALAAADDGDVMGEWAGLGYYARARNLLKCARIVAHDLGGRFPRDRAGLLALPGIGPYTAAAIGAIAFDRAETVVDGNVERVMARLHAVDMPLPAAKPVLVAHAAALTPDTRPGDYAQAVMDLGATICTPRAPACGICPWAGACTARPTGDAASYPRKAAKKARPLRHGTVYLAQNGAEWLVERRPDAGLLGGMLGFPGTDWTDTPPPPAPPLAADWQPVGQVRHVFTHFNLILQVMRTQAGGTPERGQFQRLRPSDLPSVMRKAFDLAQSAE